MGKVGSEVAHFSEENEKKKEAMRRCKYAEYTAVKL